MTTLIHDHVRVAALDRVEHGRHIARSTESDIPPVGGVRRPRKDDPDLVVALRPIDVRLLPQAIAHRDPYFSPADPDRLQLGFDLFPPRALAVVAPLLRSAIL